MHDSTVQCTRHCTSMKCTQRMFNYLSTLVCMYTCVCVPTCAVCLLMCAYMYVYATYICMYMPLCAVCACVYVHDHACSIHVYVHACMFTSVL